MHVGCRRFLPFNLCAREHTHTYAHAHTHMPMRVRTHTRVLYTHHQAHTHTSWHDTQAAGGFGRSTVNADAGAKTPLAGFVSGIVMLIVLAALSPLFYHLPKPALGSIVVVAVIGLVDTKVPLHLYKTRAYSEVFIVL
jgi:hypothetical protein